MNKEQIKEQAEQTIDLFADKINEATQCADPTTERVKKDATKAADHVEKEISTAADKERKKESR